MQGLHRQKCIGFGIFTPWEKLNRPHLVGDYLHEKDQCCGMEMTNEASENLLVNISTSIWLLESLTQNTWVRDEAKVSNGSQATRFLKSQRRPIHKEFILHCMLYTQGHYPCSTAQPHLRPQIFADQQWRSSISFRHPSAHVHVA